jgi:glycosyltransferase involved in cell wall biosynthesis
MKNTPFQKYRYSNRLSAARDKLFVILAESAWNKGTGGNSCHQYARAISKMGYQACYVDPSSGESRTRALLNKVYTPPGDREMYVLCLLPTRNFLSICKALREKGCWIVYINLDDWEDMIGNVWYDKETEIELIEMADCCFAASPVGVDRFKAIRGDILLLPNGVDIEGFRRPVRYKPRDLRVGEISLGFWGSFYCPWFDWPLIANAAREKPGWAFNIIGKADDEIKVDLGQLPLNVHLLGEKRWQDLHKYLCHFDVCLVPYAKTKGSLAANPVKTLEYLAGYKPVVAYENISIENYPYVFTYCSKGDFVKRIEEAKKIEVDRSRLDAFLNRHSWENRVRAILEFLERQTMSEIRGIQCS